jgi:hypothetical protein
MTDPSWTDVVQAVSLAVTALIVLLSALFAAGQLLDSRRTRYGQLLTDLSRRWDEPVLKNARDRLGPYKPAELRDLAQKVYEKTASEEERTAFYDLMAVPNYLEMVAVVEGKVEALPIELVDAVWGGPILTHWKKWAPTVRFMRTRPNSGENYVNLQRLKGRVKRYRTRSSAERGVRFSASYVRGVPGSGQSRLSISLVWHIRRPSSGGAKPS